ncbi:MAG: MFS transporter [Halobacteriales archaeon]
MAGTVMRRTLRWLFGEEGTVAAETELQIVMGSTAMSVAGIFVISPIVSELAGPFSVSEAAAGQLVTAFTAPSIVLVPLMGALADRIGRKPVLAGGLLIFAVAGAAVALTPSFPIALGLRAIQGFGYAAIIPIGVAILGDLYGGGREATAQGLRTASIQATNLLSPLLAGGLVLVSWRYPFLLFLVAIPIAAWTWLRLPRIDAAEPTSLRAYSYDLATSLSQPVMGSIMLSFTIRFLLIFAFFAYISVLLAESIGASAVTSGFIVSAFGLISLLTSTQVGRLTAVANTFLIMFVGFLALGGGLAIMGVAGSRVGLGAGVLLVGLGAGVTGPVQKSLVTQLVPSARRAGAVSSAVVFQSVGQAGGPLVVGIALGIISVGQAFVAVGLLGGTIGALLLGIAYARSERSDIT